MPCGQRRYLEFRTAKSRVKGASQDVSFLRLGNHPEQDGVSRESDAARQTKTLLSPVFALRMLRVSVGDKGTK